MVEIPTKKKKTISNYIQIFVFKVNLCGTFSFLASMSKICINLYLMLQFVYQGVLKHSYPNPIRTIVLARSIKIKVLRLEFPRVKDFVQKCQYSGTIMCTK